MIGLGAAVNTARNCKSSVRIEVGNAKYFFVELQQCSNRKRAGRKQRIVSRQSTSNRHGTNGVLLVVEMKFVSAGEDATGIGKGAEADGSEFQHSAAGRGQGQPENRRWRNIRIG